MLGPFYVGDLPATTLVLSVTRGGELIDTGVYTGAEVTLTDPAGASTAWAGSVAIGSGIVTLTFGTTSPFALPGLHYLDLVLTATNVRERFDAVGIEILPTVASEHWCSAAEVYRITQQSVTRENLTKAHFDIEIVSGRLFQRLEDGILNENDIDWLKRAVAHQAVFISERPGKDTAIEATSVSEGGSSVSPTPDGVVIGSMARRALNNVSWIKSRTVRIARSYLSNEDVLNTVNGDIPEAPWRNL